MKESASENATASGRLPIQIHYEQLHSQCGTILSASISGQNEAKVARSHQFVHEIELWASVVGTRREAALLKIAAHEYQFALLALHTRPLPTFL